MNIPSESRTETAKPTRMPAMTPNLSIKSPPRGGARTIGTRFTIA